MTDLYFTLCTRSQVSNKAEIIFLRFALPSTRKPKFMGSKKILSIKTRSTQVLRFLPFKLFLVDGVFRSHNVHCTRQKRVDYWNEKERNAFLKNIILQII